MLEDDLQRHQGQLREAQEFNDVLRQQGVVRYLSDRIKTLTKVSVKKQEADSGQIQHGY